jgi:hypothetical protein
MPQITAEIQEAAWRFWQDLVARPVGPLSFRFVLQPLMSAVIAVHDGIQDARTGRSPYFWTIVSNSAERGARLREGLSATSKVIVLGLVMDAIYQLSALEAFRPGEALIVSMALAFVPYLLIRGPAARVARWRQARASVGGAQSGR